MASGVCALEVEATCGESGDAEPLAIPESMLASMRVCATCSSVDQADCSEEHGSECTISSSGPGVEGADVLLFVTAVTSGQCGATNEAGTMAYAGVCQRDQLGEPRTPPGSG